MKFLGNNFAELKYSGLLAVNGGGSDGNGYCYCYSSKCGSYGGEKHKTDYADVACYSNYCSSKGYCCAIDTPVHVSTDKDKWFLGPNS